jgi:hypothetical protein
MSKLILAANHIAWITEMSSDHTPTEVWGNLSREFNHSVTIPFLFTGDL